MYYSITKMHLAIKICYTVNELSSISCKYSRIQQGSAFVHVCPSSGHASA